MSVFLWELLEIEAPEKYCVDGKESPAFLLFPKGSIGSMDHKVSLYMNSVGLIANFTSKKKAKARLKQIVENANLPMRVYQISKYGTRRRKRILFAENKVQRVELGENPCRAFNIEEWREIALTPT